MFVLLLALCAPISSAARAAEVVLTVASDGEPVVAVPTAPPISLDVVDADIRGVLRLFGEHAGLNFVIDDTVKGTVTARLVDVPWDEALAAILMSKGLVAVPLSPSGPPPSVWVVRPLDNGRR